VMRDIRDRRPDQCSFWISRRSLTAAHSTFSPLHAAFLTWHLLHPLPAGPTQYCGIHSHCSLSGFT
jgi:hypothetical protein